MRIPDKPHMWPHPYRPFVRGILRSLRNLLREFPYQKTSDADLKCFFLVSLNKLRSRVLLWRHCNVFLPLRWTRRTSPTRTQWLTPCRPTTLSSPGRRSTTSTSTASCHVTRNPGTTSSRTTDQLSPPRETDSSGSPWTSHSTSLRPPSHSFPPR